MSSKHAVMKYDPENQIVIMEVKYAGRIQKNSLKTGQDQIGPGWVTQYVGVSSPYGDYCGFDSWSGHLPRLQAPSCEYTYRKLPIDVSLFLPFSLSWIFRNTYSGEDFKKNSESKR